jgi:hypothetical protein
MSNPPSVTAWADAIERERWQRAQFQRQRLPTFRAIARKIGRRIAYKALRSYCARMFPLT